ncbi:Zinc finger RING-CH-type [Arabidopsis thaliana x Arabidopsis arenosa]|uniref:Zinc finger RING-CH-type n=1 Tax=Arabidopsis thaliana x Arabidopsis arenosa TaxID=1240361 RepID=A0A8T1Z4E2_9BRAS|nr:Zinc finger RING-CH-type [Arabidopsis thaliana x Arabidopsis arenosa]
MGDVILFIDDTNSKVRISRCRICHEEEEESFFEVPCACSGTVKFAHRNCIQRWCDEKGNTTCEICLQVYRDGYTAVSKQSKFIEEEVTIRVNGRRRSRRLVSIAESDLSQCNSVADRGASFCRSLTFILSVFLLMKHTFDVTYGTEEYPFSVFTVLTLKAIGILLPMFIIIRTISTIQKSLRRLQYPVSY